jgi:hypothetical protein
LSKLTWTRTERGRGGSDERLGREWRYGPDGRKYPNHARIKKNAPVKKSRIRIITGAESLTGNSKSYFRIASTQQYYGVYKTRSQAIKEAKYQIGMVSEQIIDVIRVVKVSFDSDGEIHHEDVWCSTCEN